MDTFIWCDPLPSPHIGFQMGPFQVLMQILKWALILLRTASSLFRNHQNLAMENLALRQQLAVFKHQQSRPILHFSDRAFWVLVSRFWRDWRNVLHIVQPETVIRWHRQGFKRYWTWKCRKQGRPKVDQKLIKNCVS